MIELPQYLSSESVHRSLWYQVNSMHAEWDGWSVADCIYL